MLWCRTLRTQTSIIIAARYRSIARQHMQNTRHLISPTSEPRTGPKWLIHRSIRRTCSITLWNNSKIFLCGRTNPQALVRKHDNSEALSGIRDVPKSAFFVIFLLGRKQASKACEKQNQVTKNENICRHRNTRQMPVRFSLHCFFIYFVSTPVEWQDCFASRLWCSSQDLISGRAQLLNIPSLPLFFSFLLPFFPFLPFPLFPSSASFSLSLPFLPVEVLPHKSN